MGRTSRRLNTLGGNRETSFKRARVVKIRAATDELLATCGHCRQGFVLHARP
jgi:hypothetical protein